MKRLLILVGLFLVTSFATAQTANFVSGPFDEVLARAEKENKLVLIEFFASG